MWDGHRGALMVVGHRGALMVVRHRYHKLKLKASSLGVLWRCTWAQVVLLPHFSKVLGTHIIS
jgi:hypothetical protein